MRIIVQRDDFARLLTTNLRVVQSRNTIPILGFVNLSFDGNELSIRSTDLDVEVTNRIAAEGEGGDICVDAKLLSDIVKRLKGVDVTMELKDSRLHVKAGRSVFKLDTLPAEDFPSLGQPSYDAEFDIDLAGFVAPVAFAQSTEETRYYLNGVLLHVVDGNLIGVATDGHRLARTSTPLDVEFGAGIILPSKLVALLPKGAVALAVSESKVRVTSGDTVIVSKLVDGTYPDYNRVIPINNDKTARFDRDEMMGAADRVSLVSSDRGRGVRLTFAAGADAELHVRGSGEASDAVAVSYEDDTIEVGLNAAYLRDLLSAMPPGEVAMHFAEPGSPVLLSSEAAPDWRGVCMPMRV